MLCFTVKRPGKIDARKSNKSTLLIIYSSYQSICAATSIAICKVHVGAVSLFESVFSEFVLRVYHVFEPSGIDGAD